MTVPTTDVKVVWGHGPVVYTWPVFVEVTITLLMSALGFPPGLVNVLDVLFITFMLVVILTDIDLLEAAFLVAATLILFLLLVIAWFLDLRIFDLLCEDLPRYIWNVDSGSAIVLKLTVVVTLICIWIVDYVLAFFRSRFRFTREQIEHLRPWRDEVSWRLEHIKVQEKQPDVFQRILWGYTIVLYNSELKEFMEMTHVYDAAHVMEELKTLLPADVSSRTV